MGTSSNWHKQLQRKIYSDLQINYGYTYIPVLIANADNADNLRAAAEFKFASLVSNGARTDFWYEESGGS